MVSKELDEILLQHKNKLIDHLHAAYHNPELRNQSESFYIELHKDTITRLEKCVEEAYRRGWNDRESDLLTGVDRIYPAHPNTKENI